MATKARLRQSVRRPLSPHGARMMMGLMRIQVLWHGGVRPSFSKCTVRRGAEKCKFQRAGSWIMKKEKSATGSLGVLARHCCFPAIPGWKVD